jgi:hypothetical protein
MIYTYLKYNATPPDYQYIFNKKNEGQEGENKSFWGWLLTGGG